METNEGKNGHISAVVVLATYNEADSIGQVLNEVATSNSRLKDVGLEVLLVDDTSPDGTAEVATRMAQDIRLPLLVLPGKRAGLGEAYLRAFRHLSAERNVDIIVTMDADGQHDGRVVASLVRTLVDGDLDVVVGSRWIKGSSTPGLSWLRRMNSRAANAVFRTVSGTTAVQDATNSLRAYRREVIEAFDPHGLSVSGYSIQTSLIAISAAKGYRIAEVPIVFRERSHGKSKLRYVDYREAVLNLVAVRKAVRSIRRHIL